MTAFWTLGAALDAMEQHKSACKACKGSGLLRQLPIPRTLTEPLSPGCAACLQALLWRLPPCLSWGSGRPCWCRRARSSHMPCSCWEVSWQPAMRWPGKHTTTCSCSDVLLLGFNSLEGHAAAGHPSAALCCSTSFAAALLQEAGCEAHPADRPGLPAPSRGRLAVPKGAAEQRGGKSGGAQQRWRWQRVRRGRP